MQLEEFIISWKTTKGINSFEQILNWVEEKNRNTTVVINKIPLEESKDWFYDKKNGMIKNKNNSFFMISGLISQSEGVLIHEQPIIIQDEIGYLGIICKKINGILHFLMQAKIEPGNVNKIQISPTIQATKSNFTQKHGGNKPKYLEYFLDTKKHKIVVDQIQSEQSSRFLKKRNRNIIIMVDEEVEVLPSHKWMTLGQIKRLMRIDNLVNMDTRTVLSCIPYSLNNREYINIKNEFNDIYLFNSIFNDDDMSIIIDIYNYINNRKMFNNIQTQLIPLDKLESWKMINGELVSNKPADFKVVFCDILIEGREVKHWSQPLFEAIIKDEFVLFTSNICNKKMFLVKATEEVGCLDKIELGPTIQGSKAKKEYKEIYELFLKKLLDKQSVKYDVVLSEEGGRFYHEENRNIIIEIKQDEINKLPEGFFWVDFKIINLLQQINNIVNIQLRNLLSLLEI